MPSVQHDPSGDLHVQPHAHPGGWLVGPRSDQGEPSWYATANDAERAARREAAVTGRRRIVFHDRYERVRTIMPPRPAARA